MTALLKVYDETVGRGRQFGRELHLASEKITVADLIRRRVEAEVAEHNAAEQARVKAGLAHEGAKPLQWLVTPGFVERALNGPRSGSSVRDRRQLLTPPEVVDAEAQVAVALKAFERNGLIMLFDDRQVTNPDEILTVTATSTVTFLRLTPLIGG